jgi:hypothetical protein
MRSVGHSVGRQLLRRAAPAALLHPRRANSSSFSNSELPIGHGHHLQTSVTRHSLIKTACGRNFDPNSYLEMVQACCDPKWLSAIQRACAQDKEYVDMLRTEGGTSKTIEFLSSGCKSDHEFMEKLKKVLQDDRKAALSLCALQKAYVDIREKRDLDESKRAADGGGDVQGKMSEVMRNNSGGFGST